MNPAQIRAFRRLVFSLCLLLAAFAAPAPAYAHPSAPQERSLVLHIETTGPLSPAMREYLERGIKTAEQRGAHLLIMQLNTPGGQVSLMGEMVTLIREAPIPVVVYVAPAGALAGSAGTVLTMAGHVAAMAPETAIGAASPVGGEGEDLEETMETKVKEAIKATLRSLMEGRRPAEAIAVAEDTVENAIAVTSQEALAVGMIDFVATDIPDLLRQLNGFEVTTAAGEHTLQTLSTRVEYLPPSVIEQILATLTNPNIVFILLTLGVQAILIELVTPGGWVAGFVGAVAVAVAAYGIGLLGANWLGLIFLIIAFVLFVLDIKAPTHGALTAAGVGAFIVGGLVLFNSPGTPQFQRVSVPLVVALGTGIGLSFFALIMFALRSIRIPIKTGQEALQNKTGRAQTALNPNGVVRVGGEQWSARLAENEPGPIQPGDPVEIVGLEGNHLLVRRLPSP